MNFKDKKKLHKIFQKGKSNFLSTIYEEMLYECPLFQNDENDKIKIWFIRIYESFIIISKVI